MEFCKNDIVPGAQQILWTASSGGAGRWSYDFQGSLEIQPVGVDFHARLAAGENAPYKIMSVTDLVLIIPVNRRDVFHGLPEEFSEVELS
jgi:hypothetical protein